MVNNKTIPTTSQVRVSIFMPCYNLGAYIDEAIESLKAQTFTDFNLLIADDCSTDIRTVEKLQEIQSKNDAKIHVSFEKKNLGMNRICSKYIPRFKTEYILMLSADDTIESTFLQETINFLDTHPSYTAVTTYLNCFGELNDIITYNEEAATLPAMLLQNNFCGSSLIRQKDIKDQPYFYDPSDDALHEDYDLWIRLLEDGRKLGVVHKPLFNYRILSTSASHTVSFDKEIKWKNYLVNKHAEVYKKYSSEVITNLWSQIIEGNRAYETLYKAYENLDIQRLEESQKLQEAREEIDKIKAYLANVERYSLYPLARSVKRTTHRALSQARRHLK